MVGRRSSKRVSYGLPSTPVRRAAEPRTTQCAGCVADPASYVVVSATPVANCPVKEVARAVQAASPGPGASTAALAVSPAPATIARIPVEANIDESLILMGVFACDTSAHDDSSYSPRCVLSAPRRARVRRHR